MPRKFQSQPGDIVAPEHWHSSGFANTDLDLQLTQAMHAAHVINGLTYAHVVVQITTSLVDHANSRVPSVLASLTKGGLNAATKSLAIEYAARGIRVNAVSPGVINLPMQAGADDEALGALHQMGHHGRNLRHRRRCPVPRVQHRS